MRTLIKNEWIEFKEMIVDNGVKIIKLFVAAFIAGFFLFPFALLHYAYGSELSWLQSLLNSIYICSLISLGLCGLLVMALVFLYCVED